MTVKETTMKTHVFAAVTAVALTASAAHAVGLDTRGTGQPVPPQVVVTCDLSQNTVVTSFADIIGYQFWGSCTASFPGTNIPPTGAASYEGGGSWNSTNGMVNEYFSGKDTQGQGWEIHAGGTCKEDPWMAGPVAASCSGKISLATPNAPATLLGSMKVPISAGLLNAQARSWLTAKTLAAIQLEHEPPSITEPNPGEIIKFPSNLVIVPYIGSGAKTYALEWQAIVNNIWAPEKVFDEAGQTTPLSADKFGASQTWRVRARAHQSTNANWSQWVQFSVAPKLKLPIVAFACNNAVPYGATYIVTGMPATMKAGAPPTTVPIKVTNGSNQTWGAGSNYRLSYHWAQNGSVVISEGKRTFLTAPVSPCQTVPLTATVQAPPTPGTWTIEWDMVNEGVTWFSAQGVATGNKPVTVTP